MKELMQAIQKLTSAAEQIENATNAKSCLAMFPQVEEYLNAYYEQNNPGDRRLVKLLINLRYYVEQYIFSQNHLCEYCLTLIRAISKTLSRTADYDLEIRGFPEKVKARNQSILKLCDTLATQEKKPLEENSEKPFDVTIYLATYNQLELTKLCLNSIYENTKDVTHEIFLIDNGSSDGTYEHFINDSRVQVIRLIENVGLLLALQIFYEAELDSGKFWLYMNNDVLATPRWASNMLKCIRSDPRIGAVMPTTNRTAPFLCIIPPLGLYDIDAVQAFGEKYNVSNPDLWQDWIIMYGFVCLARPSVRRAFGYHEDAFYFSFYYSDGDIILSMKNAGYRAVQCRDTYVHHFDGGSTVMQRRRMALARGEYDFFQKYGYFPTDLEWVFSKYSFEFEPSVPMSILFLSVSREHPLLEVQKMHQNVGNNNSTYFAADTMERLSTKQYGENVHFEKIKNWYELDSVFDGNSFDLILYLDDIFKLRNPRRFLLAAKKRLNVNGKFVFTLENSGCLLAMNYIFMANRNSLRDACRIRKNSGVGYEFALTSLRESGLTVDSVCEIFYNEVFCYGNMETIENYRNLLHNDKTAQYERSIRSPYSAITLRKASNIDTENTMEQKLFQKGL